DDKIPNYTYEGQPLVCTKLFIEMQPQTPPKIPFECTGRSACATVAQVLLPVHSYLTRKCRNSSGGESPTYHLQFFAHDLALDKRHQARRSVPAIHVDPFEVGAPSPHRASVG